jgi:ubiquinone/menaquinone biosynthesis C-methylase UbiE
MSLPGYLRSLLLRPPTTRGAGNSTSSASALVADYWTRYNVTLHQNFISTAESLAYIHWRNDQYFGYLDLMPVDGQEGNTVLDFGCGPGHDLVGFALTSRPARLIGVDVSPSSIREARERLALHGASCEFVQFDPHSTQLPLETASVDYIHSSGVLHHVPDATPLIREFRRVLRPTGSARIMVYNCDSVWMHLFVAYMKRIVEKAYADLTLEEAFARTTDGEDCPIARVFRPDEFIALANQAGFDALFTGAAVSMHEAKILPYRFDAIQDRRTPEPSRRFLLELTYDEYGMPWYRGHRAGLDACFLLTPR